MTRHPHFSSTLPSSMNIGTERRKAAPFLRARTATHSAPGVSLGSSADHRLPISADYHRLSQAPTKQPDAFSRNPSRMTRKTQDGPAHTSMLTLAHSEKAVTISEPKGCHFSASRLTNGSKTPLPPSNDRINANAPRLSYSPRNRNTGLCPPVFCPVFNNIQPNPQNVQKRRTPLLHNPSPTPSLRRWFGPNFVTILASGVRVCST
jgi:hypothetical protein